MLSEHNQIDRSKIKILLCDVNAESCQEVLALLCKCSYQGNDSSTLLLDIMFMFN